MSKEEDVLIETLYEIPEDMESLKEPDYGDMLVNLFANNFYLGELIGNISHPTETPYTEWVYAYSRNQTLLNMSTD